MISPYLSRPCLFSRKNLSSKESINKITAAFVSNKFDIINSGNNILKLFNYDKTMYYKTNKQTREGTIATGSIKNYTYYLKPKCNFIDDSD